MNTFEETIARLTRPLNGQYPRPWMTNLQDPRTASLFVIGKNQAKGYLVERVGPHLRHLAALFNRNGETCRGLYDEVTDRPSRTRLNLDSLTRRLERLGVTGILETNVICYGTAMSDELGKPHHAGGREKGREIFRFLLEQVCPRVMIVHGASATKELAKVLGASLPAPPDGPGEIRVVQVRAAVVFVIPSLAPPEYNHWSNWAPAHLDRLADASAECLQRGHLA